MEGAIVPKRNLRMQGKDCITYVTLMLLNIIMCPYIFERGTLYKK